MKPWTRELQITPSSAETPLLLKAHPEGLAPETEITQNKQVSKTSWLYFNTHSCCVMN